VGFELAQASAERRLLENDASAEVVLVGQAEACTLAIKVCDFG
jgi:hypothetical protein